VHWTESAPLDAAETLLDGLCHPVASRLKTDVDVNSHPIVATIATHASELTLLEIARTVGAREVRNPWHRIRQPRGRRPAHGLEIGRLSPRTRAVPGLLWAAIGPGDLAQPDSPVDPRTATTTDDSDNRTLE
jgi:hypothetical protein